MWAMAGRSTALARVTTLAAPLLALVAAGCSADREASSAPPLETVDVAGSVAAAPPTSANTAIDIENVAMIGDSITVGSMAELQEAFASIGLSDVEINAESGRRMLLDGGISSGVEEVAAVLADGEAPDLWVISLGTNDVANYDVEDYAAAIEELLAAIPADAPVVWVDCYLDDYQDRSQAFDDTLRQVLAGRGNATVVDWRSVAAEDGVLSDGVHPSGFGRAEFARRVTAAVQSWMT
jgi:lysophospholipase L1-like esterase